MDQAEYAHIRDWLRDGRQPTGLLALSPEKRAKARQANQKLRELIKARRLAKKGIA